MPTKTVLPPLLALLGLLAACGGGPPPPAEQKEIPPYKPPPDVLKTSVPPYQTPLGTVFSYEDRFAKRVAVVGDFNNWNPFVTAMRKNSHGVWLALVPLRRGVYTYKFDVDGQWIADPRNFDKVQGPSGDLRSVVRVTNDLDEVFLPLAERRQEASPPRQTDQGVVFSYASLTARSVTVAGDFNHWDKTSHPLRRNRHGVWSATVRLPKGTHRYKFCVDGLWTEDPLNPASEPDGMGGTFSLVTVTTEAADPDRAPHLTDTFPVALKFHHPDLPSRIPVSVLADWNGWREGFDTLTDPDQDKVWETVVHLKPGRYLYRFRIRGTDFPDPRFPDAVETAPDGRPATRLELFLPEDRRLVRFAYRPFPFKGERGEQVRIAGDFNNWDLENDTLEWDPRNLLWVRVLDLPKGRYRYLFRVGNRLEPDPANPERVVDPNGVEYSVVVVK